MITVENILDRLHGVHKSGDGWTARCPAHPDKNPSLSITERNGKVLLNCFVGCSFESIIATLQIDAHELSARPPAQSNGQSKEIDERFVATYEDVKWMAEAFEKPECLDYLKRRGISLEVAQQLGWGFTHRKFQDQPERQPAVVTPHYASGRLVGVKYRTMDAKCFTQDTGSSMDGLYAREHLDRLTDEVFVFEGPEDIALARTYKLNATGILSTSSKLTPDDLAVLSRYRHIYLVGDNDKTGQEAMDKLELQLPHERVVRLPLPGFKDIGDLWKSNPDDFEANFREILRAQWRGVFHSFEDFESTPPLTFAIRDFLQNDGATLVGGLSGHGKTLLMLSIAKALLAGAGTKLWGYFDVMETASRIIYLIPESSLPPFKHRLKIFGLYNHLRDDRLLVRTLSMGPTPCLSDPRILTAAKNSHVFLDTAVRFSVNGDENSANDNQRGLASDIFSLLGAGARSVVGAHHSPKPFAKETVMTLENVLRGSGDIGAMVVTAFGIKQLDAEQNIIHLENVKPRDFRPPGPCQLIGRPFLDDEADFRMFKRPEECGSLGDEQQPASSSGASTIARESRAANIALLRGWLKEDPRQTSEELVTHFHNEGIEVARSTVRKYRREVEK